MVVHCLPAGNHIIVSAGMYNTAQLQVHIVNCIEAAVQGMLYCLLSDCEYQFLQHCSSAEVIDNWVKLELVTLVNFLSINIVIFLFYRLNAPQEI